MVWVPDSTVAGYLGPRDDGPHPIEDDPWDDFWHDVLSGVSGLDPTMVRPRWQTVPPTHVEFGLDWLAFGNQTTTPDWNPAMVHVDDPQGGYDILQEHELVELFCGFHGNHCEQYASITRRGLFLDQNRAALRANGVGLVEIGPFTRTPELIKQEWRPRVDMMITVRREVRYNYSVRSLLRSTGTIIANRPGDDPTTVENTFDTANIESAVPHEE